MALRLRFSVRFLAAYFWLVFGGLWLLCGLPFVLGGLHLIELEQRFARDAVTVEGLVLTRDIVRAKRKDGARSTEYQVSYRYGTDAHTLEGRDKVDVHAWEALKERGPVAVEYLPDDPARSRLAGTDGRVGAYTMTGLGTFFSVAGALILLLDLRRRFANARLRRDGVGATATVTEVAPTRLRVNGVAQWRLHYSYPDHRGRVQTGKSPLMAPAEAGAWKAGDTLPIRYDRRRPERSVWLGRSSAWREASAEAMSP